MNEDCRICPQCGHKTMKNPKYFYRVFEKIRQPNGVCDCGYFHWEQDNSIISFPISFAIPQKLIKEEVTVYSDKLSSNPKLPKKIITIIPSITSTVSDISNLSVSGQELLEEIRANGRKNHGKKKKRFKKI